MSNRLGENFHLDVEISNLDGTADEMKKLRTLLISGLEGIATGLSFGSSASADKGALHIVKFRVLDGKNFELDSVKGWLHQALFVGWQINATSVRPSA